MGAAYLALSNPIALAAAQTPQALPPPKSPTNPLLVKIADVAPLNQPDLPEQPEVVYTPPAPVFVAPVVSSGSCGDWMAAAGVGGASAMALINGESGCNPWSVNASSGACGVAQELPCGKSGCSLGDGYCEMRWMNSYVIGTYGSWDNAYYTWLNRSPHWY